MGAKAWLAVAGAFFVGVGATFLALRRPPPPAQTPPPPPAETPREIQLTGKLRARHVIDLAPPQDGTIVAIFAETGQEVFEGQLLLRLSNIGLETARDLARKAVDAAQDRVNSIESQIIAARLDASRARAEAAKARAEFDRLSRNYERQRYLYAEGATPRQTLDRVSSEYEAFKGAFEGYEQNARRAEERVEKLLRDLEAAKNVLRDRQEDLEDSQTNLADSEMVAPVPGVILSRKADIGQPVARSMTDFMQIATRLEEMEAVLDAPPPVLQQVRPGQQAWVFVADVGGEGIQGQVKGIDQGQVIVEFRNPYPALRPGMSTLVRIQLQP